MLFSPAVDMGAGILAYMIGMAGLAFWGIPAILIEGFVLRWWQVTRPFRTSLVMNLVSTFVGYVAGAFWLPALQKASANIVGLEGGDSSTIHYYEVGSHTILTFVFIIIISWVLSILIEGGILLILEKSVQKKAAWTAVVVANALSYITPAVVISIWLGAQSST